MSKLKTALLNRRRVDPGETLDLSALRAATDLALYDDANGEEVCRAAAGRDVLVSKEVSIDADTMHRLATIGVRLICEAGTGYDNLAVAAARAAGITVCNVPRYSTAAVAQLAMSFVLGIASGTLGFVRRTSRGDFHDFTSTPAPSFELAGKVIGIVGPGAIGLSVAERARGFEMQVLTSGRRPHTWNDAGMRDVQLPELLAESDFVSLHCPLRREAGESCTLHLIDNAALRQMKSSAWCINVSRGGLVNEQDLVNAVENGVVAGAALDVHEREPGEPWQGLQQSERIFLTPHSGWRAVEARQRLLDEVATNIAAFAAGRPIHVVT